MRSHPKLELVSPALVALVLLSLPGCNTVYQGSYPDGLASFPERTISAAAAVRAAEPYLDQSFALCRSSRSSDWPDWEPQIVVKLEGKQYSVLKDNYPYKSYSEYHFNHAVKVNAE